MYSFTLTAVGNLARAPERTKHASGDYTRLCLVGNDVVGKDDHGKTRDMVSSVWFVAFGGLGEILANNARKGDQLFLLAQLRSNTWTHKDGTSRHDHSYVIQQFRFGAPGRATRDELAVREAQALLAPF